MSDANIPFDALCLLLRHLGFDQRIRGDHYIFTQDNIREILNIEGSRAASCGDCARCSIQPRGQMAKPYQVKQVREIILTYRLGDMNHG